MTDSTSLQERYEHALLGVFGRPLAVLDHGRGAEVWDVDGRRHLDLLGGIAVNALGHAHPAVVDAIAAQAPSLVHVSNFFTTQPQIALAERLLGVAAAPPGSRVFFTNSGTEAIEAAVKLSRRTGRRRLVALEGAFHGRSMGALSLTHKAAYREPFAPLLDEVVHVPFDDLDALERVVDDSVAAIFVEPVQGEAGVRPLSTAYLRLARDLATQHGSLLVLDEIQSGIGRTGRWFAHQESGVVPDAMTVAKGLGGGFPIGALVTFGEPVSTLLRPGQHGTTFGGNPLGAAVGLAVLETIEADGLLEHARELGTHLKEAVGALRHPLVAEVRGAGLLLAVVLTDDIGPDVARRALEAGFIVNPVSANTLRLAPPLVITREQLDEFVAALPALLSSTPTKER